jgi:type IV pilus assembly protein PilA
MSAHPLDKARSMRRDGEDGFTLIELLVVVVILGILIAIAIPTYLNYRKSANDKAAQSDLRNAISTFEVCNSDVGYPKTASTAGVLTGCDSQSNKVSLSKDTVLTYYPDSATAPSAYIIEATNTSGSTPAKVYCYTSAAGGSVKAITANTVVTAYQAACPA